MSRFFRVAVFIVVLPFMGTAQACINDREVEKYEREFKSSYPTQTQPEKTAPSGERILVGVGAGVGATLVLLGLYLTTASPSSRRLRLPPPPADLPPGKGLE